MRTISDELAKQRMDSIIEQIILNSEPIQITSKKGSVVMISLEDWSAIQETLYLLSVPGMRESILEADKTPLEEWKTPDKIGWDI